jgi:N-glycosylase/DNA lyase
MTERSWPLRDYDLAETLLSGQAFRWNRNGDCWNGVVAGRWVELTVSGDPFKPSGHAQLTARTVVPQSDWKWITEYVGIDEDLPGIIRSFPVDPTLSEAVNACRGLRLLRQDPWECLASFICSSTKQIVQIREIIRLLCRDFGTAIPAQSVDGIAHSFPMPEAIASTSEARLRRCKLGFRAPYILGTARRVWSGQLDLDGLRGLSTDEAREALIECPGVGRKIADCVLLFAYGRQDAFPIDVWVQRILKNIYFKGKRRVSAQRLREFPLHYFGANAGYAQQYLFHYARTRLGRQWE